MPLELGPVSRQVDKMVRESADRLPVRNRLLLQAQELLLHIDADSLRDKLKRYGQACR